MAEGTIVVEPTAFQRLLKSLTLPKASRPLLEPLRFEFTREGLRVLQKDTANIIGVVSLIKPNFFTNYDVEGVCSVNSSSLLKIFKSAFRADKQITIELDEERIRIKGETEYYEELLSSIEPPLIKPDIVKQTTYGFLIKTLEVDRGFKVDSMNLDVSGSDVISFDYDDGLKITIETEISKYSKVLPVDVNKIGDGAGRATVFTDHLSRVARNVSGIVWLIFTKDPSRPDAKTPIVISQTTDKYVITYMIVQKAV